MTSGDDARFVISVVIVNWNGRALLADCLASLRAQTDEAFEVIVVDNGSMDGSLAWLASEHPEVRVVATGRNLGFAEAVNRGIDAAHGAWIATLNNDTVARPTWLEALRRAAVASEPRVGMIQSRLVFRRAPGRTNSTGILLFDNGCAKDRGFDEAVREDDLSTEVFCPTAGAALYRRDMLDDVRLPSGVFDRAFFMYLEDVDLGWRCRLAGWSAVYAPEAVVEHEFQASAKKHAGRLMGVTIRKNRVRMLLKNGSWAFVARTLPRTVVDTVEAVVWEGAKVLPGFLEAARDGLRQRGAVRRIEESPRDAIERRWLEPAPEEDSVRREITKAATALLGKLGRG